MPSITPLPFPGQAEKLKSNRRTRRSASEPAEPPPGPYRPSAFILGVHSLDPAASIVSQLPESIDYVRTIEEKVLIRTILRPGRRAMGPEPSPLVSNPKSHPTLPPWKYVPSEPSWCYQVYRKDAYVCRHFPATPPPEQSPALRAAIYEFSDKSRAHLDHVCCNSGHLIRSQFCLTYHEQQPNDGREVKTHLEKWIKALRRRFPGVGYLWVLEFQKRRVPHYHVWLTVQPDTTLQKKMARSWVRITKGTESQYWWHCRKENWIEWKMEDGQYAKKYAVKQVQKEVPPEYQNVGRFWASSRNLKPEPTHYGPEEVAKLTRTTAVPWEAAAVRHYFDKVLRRFQEHQMNYDRQGRRRINPKTGKVQPYRKAAMVRSCSELSGNFKIRNGSKAIAQLLNYIVTHPPDPYSLAKAIAARVPF